MVDPVTYDDLLVVILGPTASGKSGLALFLAERLGGEIVNYDSIQVYRGFNTGSGKVPPEERRGIPHYLLDLVEPEQVFTAGDYRQAALTVLRALKQRRILPILVGGTGLYLRALLLGLFEGPARSEGLRARLRRMRDRRGPTFLHRLLKRLDPPTADRIHPSDSQKIIRALEVCILARRPMSQALAQGREPLKGYRVIKIGLNPDRALLNRRIDKRVEAMFANGLLEETRRALDRPDAASLKPLIALGYRQASAALRGELTIEEALQRTQLATRQYAKRQMTWFRREPDVTWFRGFGDEPEIQSQVLDWLAQMGLQSPEGRLAAEVRASTV
jgi:tRNA dimethylallyltransferase